MYTKETLSNGLRLITVPREDTQSVTVLVLVGVGSRHEKRGINGAAHFVEHMMFKGTRKRPTTLDISRELDRYGADYNAYTGKEMTGYYIKMNSDHLDLAVDLLSDMLLNSKFDSEEVVRERGVILEEIKMYNDNPLMHVPDLFEQILYGDKHQLGWSIAGPSKVIAQMPREDLVAFKKKHYVPSNMVVAIAGNVGTNGHSPVQKLVEEKFKFKKGATGKAPKAKAFSKNASSKNVLLEQKETEQVQMIVGMPGLSMKARDRFALTLLSVILGGSMSSRLFIRVRERLGLAYYVRSEAGYYSDTGSFSVQAGVDPAKAEKALKAILAEFGRMKKSGVSKQELADAKEHVKGKMTLGMEDSSALAEWFCKQELFMGTSITPEQRLKQLEKVTREDILRLARKLFVSNKLYLSMISPYGKEDAQRFEKFLKI